MSDEQCELLAAHQHGVISREQALDAGMTPRAITRRVSSGRWRVLLPGVYAPRPVPSSWHQRLMGAVLWGGAGALASHRSSALLWGLDVGEKNVVEISIKAGRRVRGVIVHRRARSDDPPDVTREGIPTTSIERTLVDLGTVLSRPLLARAVDDALRLRLLPLDRLREVVIGLGPRRPGTRGLRQVLADRDERDSFVESRLESALLHLLRQHALPLPTPQYRVSEGKRVIARIDFAYPDLRLGLEADGYRWHTRPDAWRQDLRRENRLKLLGWTVLRFSWQDVHEHPELVASQVRAALIASTPSQMSTREVSR